VVGLCRRICVLDARSETAAAAQLRAGPLAAALARCRAEGETEEAISANLAATLHVETERVANAGVLAELMVPLLVGKLGIAGNTAAGAHSQTVPSTAAKSRHQTPAAPRIPGNIADFIDEMIAQEQPTRRPAPPPPAS